MKITQNNLLAIVLFLLLLLVMMELINFPELITYAKDEHYQVEAQVIATDNSAIAGAGPISSNRQDLIVRVLEGEFKGVSFTTVNQNLTIANISQDIAIKDTVMVELAIDDYGDVTSVRLIN